MSLRWKIHSTPEGPVRDLSSKLGVDPLVARLLLQRGLSAPDQASRFLNPRLEDLHDPYLMKDMDRVVTRLLQAVEKRHKVLIYGDYDVDGITSTVVLKRALEMLGCQVGFYLPRRLEDGYGVKTEVLQKASEDGYELVITVDSGIRAMEAASAAREFNLDLVITDHHLPGSSLPPALAILNPRRNDCPYPDKDLAAVGVVFKLVQALFLRTGRERNVHHFLKLVAIGTLADLVPMRGENRVIVRFGLEGLGRPQNVGLRALLSSVGVGAEISGSDVGFKLAPRINAVTRMGGGREVVELFSVQNPADAVAIVEEMNTKNLLRRQEEKGILDAIEMRIQEDPESFAGKFLLVAGQDWHRGVIGIVASRLVERFHRPVLVLSVTDSSAQGSGRSIPGFHLLEALEECKDFFAQYGGHAQAVGCRLKTDCIGAKKIQELSDRLNERATPLLANHQLVPTLSIDTVLPPEEISFSLYRAVEKLSPFGIGNPMPVFASRKVNVVDGPWLLKDQHLKMRVQCNGSRLDAIWWKNTSLAENIRPGSQVDMAYTLDRDNFRGKDQLLLTVRDIQLP